MFSKNIKENIVKILGFLLIYGFLHSQAFALTYQIPSNGSTIGEYKKVRAGQYDTLPEIAEAFDIGVLDMIQANPKLNNKVINSSTWVVIPEEFELPSGPREGIVLDLAQLRVFYYHPNSNLVSTYPVGIGRQGWSTPQGTTYIASKKKDPAWHPTASIRREAARNGKTLPSVVAPGPHNPLGKYALYLGFKGILMHGTNKPSSVGLRSSHGCIRMYANDIQELFSTAPIGTKVRIIYDSH
jgi:L,D-transpeptidase ErfK/SrfK